MPTEKPAPAAEENPEDIWAEMEAAEAKTEAKPNGKLPDDHSFAGNPESANDKPEDGQAAAPAAAAVQPETAPDVWASAPPELRAAHDAQVKALESATTEHARRSIEGRISAYSRRLKERSEAAAQQPPPAKDDEAADPLAELAAEYPEIATPLQKKLAPIAEKLSQFDAVEKSRQEAADAQMDAELQANEQLLESKHPGWDGYLKEHGAAFGKWIVDQPLKYRQAFITNKEAIIDPMGAIDTLNAFKQHVDSSQQPPTPAQDKPAPAAAQPQGLNSRRAAQLAGSTTPQTAGQRPTVSGIPQDGDEQAIWNAFAAVDPDEIKLRSAR